MIINDKWLAAGMTAYRPELARGRWPEGGEPDLFWFAFIDYPSADIAGEQRRFAARGYQRLLHKYYPAPIYDPLHLELYARPGVWPSGADLDSRLPAEAARAAITGWRLPASAEVLDDGGTRQLRLAAPGPPGEEAQFATPATGGGLFLLELDARPGAEGGTIEVSFACRDSVGGQAPASMAQSVALAPGAWQPVRAVALCPADTAALRVALRAGGPGEVLLREPRLSRATGGR